MDFHNLEIPRPTPGREAPKKPDIKPAVLAAAIKTCAAEESEGKHTEPVIDMENAPISQVGCRGATTTVDEAEGAGINRTYPPKASEPPKLDTLTDKDSVRADDVSHGLDTPERDGERRSRASSRGNTRVLRSSRDSLSARSRTPIARASSSLSLQGAKETERDRSPAKSAASSRYVGTPQRAWIGEGLRVKDGVDLSLLNFQPQVVLTRMEDEAANSDSGASMITVSSRSRSSHEALNESPSRKRTREVLEAKASRATYSPRNAGLKGRGRGRPTSMGARAEKLLLKEAAKQARREARDEEVLQEMLEWSQKMAVAKSRVEYSSREQTTAEMVQTIRASCDAIYLAVDKSGHL
ncbi:hypothetical protein ABMA28_012949 [Loxostege sticticalis]|uniref:Uncharacterized protein n=1 Tax=Loxostege sticticalis TaxID=481309 RepID=A0ABD0S354_LOXSC